MNNHSLRNYFTRFPILSNLRSDQLDALAEATELRKLGKGAFIFLPDDPCDYLYFVVQGTVKTGSYAEDGREIIKCICHAGGVLGELGLAGERYYYNFAAVLSTDTWFLVIPIPEFTTLMSESFELTRNVLVHLGGRLRRTERQCESLMLKDVRARIVDFLKQHADERGKKVGYEMLIKHGLTQQDIANMVGASRQTVAAVLNELRRSNIIHFSRNTILIRDLEKL